MEYLKGKQIEEIIYKIKTTLGYYGDNKESDKENLCDLLEEIKDELEEIIKQS